MALATTGRPEAIASRSASGRPSIVDDSENTSIAASKGPTSACAPAKWIAAAEGEAAACASRRARSPPSPTNSRCAPAASSGSAARIRNP